MLDRTMVNYKHQNLNHMHIPIPIPTNSLHVQHTPINSLAISNCETVSFQTVTCSESSYNIKSDTSIVKSKINTKLN